MPATQKSSFDRLGVVWLIAAVAVIALRLPNSKPATKPVPAESTAAPAHAPVPEAPQSAERARSVDSMETVSNGASDADFPSRFLSDNPKQSRWTRSSWEEFLARSVDPLFRKSNGWQVYNPDRLDGVLETARRPTQFAFSFGLKFSRSF
jgi:hypothetical protein